MGVESQVKPHPAVPGEADTDICLVANNNLEASTEQAEQIRWGPGSPGDIVSFQTSVRVTLLPNSIGPFGELESVPVGFL